MDYFTVFTYAIPGTEGADAGGGGGGVAKLTDAASTPPSSEVASSEVMGRRDTMLAIR
jgi:hypothetical protein